MLLRGSYYSLYICNEIIFCLKMKLHIFNPEHDIALAANIERFTPPHAGRELKADLGFIPALWADDGDFVLVDDVDAALDSVRHLKKYARDVVFVTLADLSNIPPCKLSVWGWNSSLRFQLLKAGVEEANLPSIPFLKLLREMSNRRWAAERVLPELLTDSNVLIGEACPISDLEVIRKSTVPFVLKAPWSSSGRGVRYVDRLTPQMENWALNIMDRQGFVMMEPLYDKVKDFALEFESTNSGVRYLGLSLFKTINGAYAGNILASEADKRMMLGKYISMELIDGLAERISAILTVFFHESYRGPFGIDMMVVRDGGKLKVHPCVELNLRRTMGFVALSFGVKATEAQKLMQISYAGKYHFRVLNTAENVINNGLV